MRSDEIHPEVTEKLDAIDSGALGTMAEIELTVPDPARILVCPSHRKREEEPCRTNS